MLGAALSLLVFLLGTVGVSAQGECICYQEVASDLSNPLLLVSPPDGSSRYFVASQLGVVFIYDSEWNQNPEPFLDIQDIVVVEPGYDERGFLGLAFHPGFADNGKVFVYFNTRSDSGSEITRLSQFLVQESNPDVVDLDSEIIMLDLEQPFTNHNGATLMFGVDNLLYVTLGDGGSAGDPFENAQNKGVLLGKILRLNVDDVSAETPYVIPEDNPFVDEPGSLGEIYSYGWRNPWRCDVDEGDPESGENRGRIICADVGQDAWEEVDIVEIGGNYGWNSREGLECFDEATCGNIGPEVLPIHVYPHDLGGFISVTGGNVYRGCLNPHLNGIYVFADLSLSTVWQLTEDPGTGQWTQADLAVCPADQCSGDGFGTSIGRFILSFGEDFNGEMYVLSTDSLDPFDSSGKVYKIVDPNSTAEC